MKYLSRLVLVTAIISTTGLTEKVNAEGFTVHAPNVEVDISNNGQVMGVLLGAKGLRWNVAGSTELAGCRVEGRIESARKKGGIVRFKKHLTCDADGKPRKVTLSETFSPTKDSVRWEIDLAGHGQPWSTDIETRLHIPQDGTRKFWTTWGDPRPDEDVEPSWISDPSWQDPLVPTAFPNRKFWYGAAYYRYDKPRMGVPQPFRDVICIPLATVLDPLTDSGLSLALSPQDVTIEMTLETSANGDIQFHRLFRRITEGSPVHFSMDLVSHEGDWRGGMRWMTARYPEYFNPPLASAHRFGGTGAYSSYEGPLDAAKLKQMAFTVNWKASFDFPYQGMFIPPVADDESWPRGYTKSESPPIELGPTTSIPQIAGYSRRMREMGFDVLNYFNAAEFGKNIVYPPAGRKAQSDAELWKDPNDYLNAKLADALIYRPENEIATPGGPEQKDPYCRAAYGNVVLDWGEPSWQNFLLEQARLLIKKIPDSAGIAFDRLDWMRLYNFRRDDGVTWYNGPARSMVTAWKDLLKKLDPIEHPAGQVIFVNNLVSRLDTLRYVDGLFSELAYWGGNLNSTAFLGVSKPVITWVFGEYTLKQLAEQRATAGKNGEVGWVFGENSSTAEADAFLQKFLYLGLFPMAPFPQNDHSLMPSPAADRIYLDYGPLFLAMRGRKWVLWPHPVSVQGSPAKVNMFEIPDGYLISVTFGGADSDSIVTVRGVPGIAPGKKLRCRIIHPGESDWTASEVITRGNEVTLNVPLRRGCALAKLHFE